MKGLLTTGIAWSAIKKAAIFLRFADAAQQPVARLHTFFSYTSDEVLIIVNC